MNTNARPKLFSFLTVAFLNAFTDVGHKIILHNAIFKYYDGTQQMILAAVINALILLPFVLCFSPAGYLSDKYSKKKIIQISSFLAIPITAAIFWSYSQGWFWLSFSFTFLLALQSAIYGPAKYGYIQELMGNQKLPKGIGYLQSTTIVAILLSSFLYSFGFEKLFQSSASLGQILNEVKLLGLFLLLASILEFLLSFRITPTQTKPKNLQFSLGPYLKGQYLRQNLKDIHNHKNVFKYIAALSFFWSINQVVLAAFPAFFKEATKIENVMIAQGIAALAGVGIIAGCLYAGRKTTSHISSKQIITSALFMALGLLLMPAMSQPLSMAILIILYGFFGGAYLVPLNSLLQTSVDINILARIIAGKNFYQNVWMLVFLGLSVFAVYYALSLSGVFYGMGLLLLLVCIWLKKVLNKN